MLCKTIEFCLITSNTKKIEKNRKRMKHSYNFLMLYISFLFSNRARDFSDSYVNLTAYNRLKIILFKIHFLKLIDIMKLHKKIELNWEIVRNRYSNVSNALEICLYVSYFTSGDISFSFILIKMISDKKRKLISWHFIFEKMIYDNKMY